MSPSRPFPRISGSLTITSGSYRMTVEGQAERLVLRIASWRTLLHLRKSVSKILPELARTPIEFTEIPPTIIALRSMPIARVIADGGNFKIRPTPMKAIFSRV
ncbi:hypothetical protein [Haloferula sp.]|uniref:hypothetical protein n=1 Tax=Haloferula sp. TaxID=2497595 RepID=UPI003C781113